MVRFEVGFTPHPFERGAVEQTKSELQQRLAGQEIDRLKIVLTKPPGSQTIALRITGDPEAAEKARRILGIY